MTYRTSFTAAARADREETIVDGRFSSSGDISLADGTATQGAIYFADDKNTGIYSPSNDSIAFSTEGKLALTIDSSQNVRIGRGTSTIPGHYYNDLVIDNSDGTGSPDDGSGADTSSGITIISSTSQYGGLTFSDTGADQRGAIKYKHGTNAATEFLQFTSGGDESLRLDFDHNATFEGKVFVIAHSGDTRLSMDHTGGGNFVIKNPTAASLSFGTNNNDDELTIANGGNTTIKEHLYIKGGGTANKFETTATGASVTGKLDVTGGTSGGGHQNLLELKHSNSDTSGDGPALLFNGYYDNSNPGVSNEWAFAKISAANRGTNYGADLKFYVHPADDDQTSSVVEALTITGNGTGGDTTFAGNITVSNTKPTITLNDSNNESDYWIQNDDGVFAIKDLDTSGGIGRMTIAPNGVTTFSGNCDFSNGIDVTGAATFAGGVSVGGTTHGTAASLSNIWLGATGHLYSETAAGTGNSISISQNAHVDSDGSWEYIHGDKAANIYLYNGTWGFRTAAAGVAGNNITWSETLLLNHDGNAEFSGNIKMAATKGVQFSAYDEDTTDGNNISSNTLDDYEEGTWTPVLQYFTSGAYQNVTMEVAGTITLPKYTKVGRWVTATFVWTGFKVDSGTLAYARVTGLPFTTAATGAALVGKHNCFSQTQSVGGWLANGQTSIDFFYDGSNANNWISSAGSELQLSCHYQV